MLNLRNDGKIRTAALLICVVFLMLCPASSWAANSVISESHKLELVVGKSKIVKSPSPVKRVSIAAPEIADFILISPQEIYVTGKAAGVTNLTLWQNKKVRAIYDLEVTYDVSRLKQKIHSVLPDEAKVRVIAAHDSVSLSGTVSSAANLSQILALAQAFVPKEKIVNLLEVGGVHQVMLEVRVAEMSRSLGRRLGINFAYTRGGDFGVSTLAGLTQVVSPDDATLLQPPLGLLVSPAVNALFRFHSGDATWSGFIDALKEDGLVKVLAEPTLLALSGQQASFLAGGEFPVPVPQRFETITIEYKRFGAELYFTPTVLSENKISINVTPSVSELDFTTAVAFGGFVVPGLRKRSASTVVELADGQSFAIAGLISETVRDSIQKFPLLGDIPILGVLFRSREFQRKETELIIVVTPHLVKPLDMAKQTLPTDYYIEPDDIEFYLLGSMEGKKRQSTQAEAEFDGQVGHAMPVTQ